MVRTFSGKCLAIYGVLLALLIVTASPVSAQPAGTALVEHQVILTMPPGIDTEWTVVEVCVGLSRSTDGSLMPAMFMATIEFTNPNDGLEYEIGDLVPFTSQADLQNILNHVNADTTGELVDPFGGINNDGDCADEIITPGQVVGPPVPAHVELPSQAGPKCTSLKKPENNPLCVTVP